MENSNYQPGWYRFDLANKIKKGKIYSYHYFGKPLVCFRDKNNIVNIFDAHCPHLGAHLGVGGTIKNNRLICPFHGWQYDTQGKCVEIPYCKTIPTKALLHRYASQEINSIVYIHHGNAISEFPLQNKILKIFLTQKTTQPFLEKWIKETKIYQLDFENIASGFFIDKTNSLSISHTPIEDKNIIFELSYWYEKNFTLLNIFSKKRTAFKKLGKIMRELPLSFHPIS